MSAYEAEGIWGHIVHHAQRVEVSELARIIGVKDLEENSNLWIELKAYSSILSDLANADLGSSSGVNDELVFSGDSGAGPSGAWAALSEANLKSQGSVVPSLDLGGGAMASNNSGQESNSNNSTSRKGGSQLTGRSSARSMDSLEFVLSIEEHINVDSIHHVVEQVRRALLSERSDLRSEISVLQNAMDGETDVISARAASAHHRPSSKQREKKSKMSRFQSGNNANPAHASSQVSGTGTGTGTGGECGACRRLNTDQEVEPGKIRPNKSNNKQLSGSASLSSVGVSRSEYLSQLYTQQQQPQGRGGRQFVQCPDCFEKSSNPGHGRRGCSNSLPPEEKSGESSGGIAMGGGKSRSRMRNKLQAARDEKHFLDFDM